MSAPYLRLCESFGWTGLQHGLNGSSLSLCLTSPLSAPSRGNSKYHYYGIRVKPDSPLNRLQEDTQYMAMRQQPVHQKQRSVCSLSLPTLTVSITHRLGNQVYYVTHF